MSLRVMLGTNALLYRRIAVLSWLGTVLVVAACTPTHFIPAPGALPMPQAMADAECRSAIRTTEPVAIGAGSGLTADQQKAVVYRNCMYERGWVQPGDDYTAAAARASVRQPTILTAGLTAQGKSPSQISNDQVYCLLAISRNTGYRPILPHVADPYTGMYDEAELTDNLAATPTEAGLLAGYGEEADRCTWHMLQDMSYAAPRFSPILERRAKEGKLISVDLINRHITFAEAVRRQNNSIRRAKDAIIAANR